MPEIAQAVEEMDWLLPTDIQAESIPLILGGGDVLMVCLLLGRYLGAEDTILWQFVTHLKSAVGLEMVFSPKLLLFTLRIHTLYSE